MGAGGERVPGTGIYLGTWGDFGTLPHKGITTHSLSPNRQKPMAGALHAAVFNTWRRFRGSVLYVVPPFIGAYFLMDWAQKRNEFLNSKAGRALYAEEE